MTMLTTGGYAVTGGAVVRVGAVARMEMGRAMRHTSSGVTAECVLRAITVSEADRLISVGYVDAR